MARIPDEVKTFLDEGRLAYVATCGRDGRPHLVPKGSVAVLDDEHLVFADLYTGQTRKNLEENPHISVAVVNPAGYVGYEVRGLAEIVERGPAFDAIAARVTHGQMTYHRAKHGVKIRVEEVVELKP
jgi:hypothetical protein